MILPTLLRDVFHAKREPAVHNLLNLWAIEDDALVGVDLQYTRLFRLTCPDALFFTEAEIEQLRVDLTLARNECARLRGVIEVAADKLRSEGYVVGERMLLDARFPQEVKS